MKCKYLLNFLFCALLTVLAKGAMAQQNRTISGVVTNAEQKPLSGVSVLAALSNTGTMTNAEGHFSLQVGKDQHSLSFSYVGYLSKDIAISGSELHVTLTEDSLTTLNDIIVIGYGTVRKKDLTGSITSVTAKDFNQGVVSSPDQLLQGKVAGLNIVRSSGDPTAGATMQLRGPSSLTAGINPFYVIDGVPGANINLVAPSDIVSMDVLKDASSTAIYGSRAANGVIMVTTKHGKAGKPVVSYNGYAALETIANKLDVLDAGQYTQFLKDHDMEVAASEGGHATNWQDQIYRNGVSHNHNLSLFGGNETTKYNASVNYLKQDGIVKNNDLERFIARVGIDQSLFNNKVRVNLSLVNSASNADHVDYGIFNGAARYLPVSPILSDAAEYTQYGGYFQVPGRINYYNPVAMLNQRSEKQINNLFQTSTKIEADLAKGLLLTVTGSLQRETYDRQYYQSRYDISPTAIGKGYAQRTFIKNSDKVLEANLNYDKTFAGKHNLKLLAGYSYQNTINNDGMIGANSNFTSDDLGAGNLNAGSDAVNGLINPYSDYPIKQESTLMAYFGRVNYSYADKYLLSATIRRDGSSKFGKNNRWATFPSVAAAWRISQEEFMKSQSLFSDLKLRVGYGVSGNQNIAPYSSLVQYGPQGDQFLYNGTWTNSFSVIQNPNPNLKWETTSMVNIGLDFELLQGRISGTFEYYDKKTSDLLYTYDVPSPPYLFNTLLANGGSMTNKGFEVTLSAAVVKKSDWGWTTFGNFSTNKNKIGSLKSNIDNLNVTQRLDGYISLDGWTSQSASIVLPGHPLGTFYTFKYVGYDAATQKTIYQTPSGALKTADQLQTPDDYQIVGQALPKFTYGWGNNFNYKNLDLSFFFRGVYGNKIYNATRADLSRLTQATSTNISPLAVKDGIFEAPINSSRWLEDGSFIRLDNATLGYNVPVKKSHVIHGLRFYITATNIFILTKYTGVDPEVNMSGLAPGIDDRNYYPKTRSFLFGANITL